MKISKTLIFGSLAVASMALVAAGANNRADAMSKKPEAAVQAVKPAVAPATYQATFYVAAMGGHFAKAEVTIDPAAENPIHLNKLTKIDIGDEATHATHDARIDNRNRDLLFWSTYHIDQTTGKTHVGKSDLKTGKVLMDIDVPTPEGVAITNHMYCASGQTNDYFLPISMSNKGYIDVFRKSDLTRVRSVFLEGTEADIHKPYVFYHGTNSPDMKKFFMTINEADKDQGTPIGKMHLVMLDTDDLVNGKVTVLKKGLAPGAKARTYSFRQYFSPDGKLIANSGGDRMYLIDADTLEVLDNEMMLPLEENHDGIFTPDSRYVIATSRTKTLVGGNYEKIDRSSYECATEKAPDKDLGNDDYYMDGQLKLYDVAARKFIGTATSVCLACHNEEGVDQHAVLCGIDANWGSPK